MSKYPKVWDDAEKQAHYEECRRNGCDHKFAEMLSAKKAPKVRDTYSPLHPRRGRGQGY